MSRISLRQAMVAWFILILVLLGGTVVQNWLLLETLITQNRNSSEQSVRLSTTLQELGERSIDLERSARQYLLVRQDAFRASFNTVLAQSLGLIQQLEADSAIPLQPMLDEWRITARELEKNLDNPDTEATLLATQLSKLRELYNHIRQTCQQWMDARNQRQLAELEAKQAQLKLQLLFALVASIVATVLLGWWMICPIRQIGQAITLMGHGYFNDKIAVHGPADMRHLGKRLDWLRRWFARLEVDRKTVFHHIAQELETPIVAIREACALLADNTSPVNRESIIDILRHNANILQNQLNGLTRMAIQVFDASRQQRQQVSLTQFLQHSANAQTERCREKNLSIRVEAPEIHVRLDTENVNTVLAVLLENAIAFSPENSEIILRATHDKESLRLECQDQGAGVAPEDAEHIFDPFYQGANQPRQGGGIGLTIARELAHLMGGNVQYLNHGVGACFCVNLPHEV
jgi:two-component system sensor histidine kinase GlrK